VPQSTLSAVGARPQPRRRTRIAQAHVPWLLLAPTLIILVPLPIFLIGYILWNSLFDWTLTMPWIGKAFVGLDNFRKLLADHDSLQSILTAIIFTSATLLAELGLGLGVGHLVARESRTMSALRGLILLPLVITPVVVGLLWRMMYQGDLGIISYLIGALGFPKTTILADLRLALPAVIIVSIWQNAPFLILVVVAGLKALPPEPFEAAVIDGANGWQMFLRISLPLLRPLLLIALLLRFIDAFKTFDLIYIMTGGGPAIRTETISMHIFREGFLVFHIGYAATLTIVLLIVVNLFAAGFFNVMGERKKRIRSA
jgi:multiple sugar transport system permease protein